MSIDSQLTVNSIISLFFCRCNNQKICNDEYRRIFKQREFYFQTPEETKDQRRIRYTD